MPATKPMLVRLRDDTRALLERAKEDQRRSMASIIDEAVREKLKQRYGALDARLQQLLGGK